MSDRMTVEELIALIPEGQKNAVQKSELMLKTGFSERKIRKMIEEAADETPVINLQDGKGYFRPAEEDMALVMKFYNQEMNRAKAVFKRVNHLKAYIEQHHAEVQGVPIGKTRVREHWRELPKQAQVEGQLSLDI